MSGNTENGTWREQSLNEAMPSKPMAAHISQPIPALDPGLPAAQGLYSPLYEHDACGVGFVADMHNRKSHEIVEMGLKILLNLDHRGAVGADPKAGDGCGMLVKFHINFLRPRPPNVVLHCPLPAIMPSAICFCRAMPTAAELSK